MADTVSVIIPAYNAAAHVRRAIDSVLAQTHKPVEVIVVDDGSRDRTAEVVEALPSPVRLIRKPNGGPATARNLGAQEAKGKWLALLDADDWWHPEKLAAQLACDTDPSIGMIHCLPEHRNEVVPPVLTFELLWARNWVINSSVLIRAEAFHELGGFNEDRALISVEDYNLWVRVAASRWKIVTCPRVLVHYTRGIGISSNTERFLKACLYNIEDLGKQLNLPPAVVERRQNDIIAEFGRSALFRRDMASARKLLWQAMKKQPSTDLALRLAVANLPRRVLDMRRNLSQMLNPEPPSPDESADDDTPVPDPRAARTSVLDTSLHTPAADGAFDRPVLVVTVDAEEEFDWNQPFSRAATGVTSMRSQYKAHRIFERYGMIPTYMVDYPVASQDAGRAPLRELLGSGLCDVGAQLHPWVTPPFIEELNPRNSFPGNLPRSLEYAKIRSLTEEVEAAFGVRPRIFRAGRYGAGPNTGSILHQFGYQADSSVMPNWSFQGEGGPDFRSFTPRPFWIDPDRSLLELPLSASLVGVALGLPPALTTRLFGQHIVDTRLPSAMARLGVLERIKLTPEGISVEEARRLVRFMLRQGHKVFVLSYHTPSLEPGNTPYVRNERDLERFLRWIDEFLDFFTSEVGGVPSTWSQVRARLLATPA